jgi:cell volume regulation protein A
MQIEFFLLVISLLFIVSILVGKAGSRYGMPALLLFLGVGMLFGSDGLGLVHFDNIKLAHMVGTVALSAILFSGGLDTKISDIRPVLGPGIVLATLGVLLTAVGTGIILYLLLGHRQGVSLGVMGCLLLASTMSSTDSASVFSILRGKGLNLKHNLRPTLELESGSNDPMAYVLTTTFISLMLQGGSPHYGAAVLTLVVQLVVGVLAGFAMGKGMVWLVNKIDIDNVALYPILVLTGSFFVFAVTFYLHGNSFLAVYIAGLIVGNSRFVHKRSTRNFFDGITWIAQLTMFLTLGLLVNPSELHQVLLPGLIISVVMIFITRPLSVFASMAFFREYSLRDRIFVSWVGLRGAVPIIFAILCRVEGVPGSEVMFNIVFLCTLTSLVVQGTTLPIVARWLGVGEPPKVEPRIENFDIDFPEEIKSAATEVEITSQILVNGNRLMDLRLPEKTLAILVKRGDNYFVPTGKTVLHLGDHLMLLTDDKQAMNDTLQKLGVATEEHPLKTITHPWYSALFDDE